jgi:hypothetical protein
LTISTTPVRFDVHPRPGKSAARASSQANRAAQWLQSGPEVWQVRLERVAVPG